MSLKDEQFKVQKAMNNSLSGLQEDIWLTQRVLANAEGEEPVKRKLSALTIVVIVVLCLSMTGALAAVLGTLGIIDFAGNLSNTYVPENAAEAITHEDIKVETEHLKCTIEESFYDGKVLYLTTRLEPKDNVLLIFDSESPAFPLRNLNPSFEEGKSIGEYALEKCDGHMAEVTLNTTDEASGDFRLNEDGSAVVYSTFYFPDEQLEREISLRLSYLPLMDVAGLSLDELDSGEVTIYDVDAMENTEIPLRLKSAELHKFVYNEPLEFPSVGVQITKVVLSVTPFEIRYDLQFTVTDEEKYNAQENGLWFEFIDMNSTETEYFKQRVLNGLSGESRISRLDESDFGPVAVGTQFVQTGTIGLNALNDIYTIRACNSWKETRYETVQFQVNEQ